MQHLNTLFENYTPAPPTRDIKSARDEMLKDHITSINAERAKAGYRPISLRSLAIRINKNPFLAGKEHDSDLFALLKKCRERGSYSKLFYVTK